MIHQARNARGGCQRPPQNPTVGAFCGKPLVLALLVLSFGVLPGRAQDASSWPQRSLMEATFENSMEYRYLSKQVYESSVVDDMEAEGSWSVSGIGTIAYTTQCAIDLQLSAQRLEAGVVQVEARVRGAGAHQVELRAFNGSASGSQGAVNLTAGQEQTLTWKLSVASVDKPWAVVVIPDGSTSDRKELSGTAGDLPAIE